MIYYSVDNRYNYLAHHGVLGMHWGIRRYQPYSVKPRGSGKGGKEIGDAKSLKKKERDYNRQLSKLTRERDINKIKLYDATRKQTEKNSKHKFLNETDKNVEKYKTRLNDVEKSINSVLDNARKDGMHVQEYTRTRDIAAGRKALATVLGAIGGFYMGNIVGKLAIASGVKTSSSSDNIVKPIDVKPINVKPINVKPITNSPSTAISNNSVLSKGRISGAITGALVGRRMYDQAYRAAHKRGSKIKGTRYKVSRDYDRAKKREEFNSISPDDIEEFYEKKKRKDNE